MVVQKSEFGQNGQFKAFQAHLSKIRNFVRAWHFQDIFRLILQSQLFYIASQYLSQIDVKQSREYLLHTKLSIAY